MIETQHTKSNEGSLDQELDAKTLLKMSKQLQNILEIRGDLNLKVAKRVTFLTRFTITIFGVSSVSMLVFIMIMATNIVQLTKTVDTMNTLFGKMTDDMVVMNKNVATMEDRVSSIPSMKKNLVTMDKTMIDMSGGMKNMKSDMKVIRQDMDKMDKSVTQMASSFTQTENSMLKMKSDVNILAKPMRLFNKMIGR